MKNLKDQLTSNVNEGVLSQREANEIDEIIETLTADKVLDEIIAWLPNDTVKEFFEDLKRNYDID